MSAVEEKREREKEVVSLMISLYCRKKTRQQERGTLPKMQGAERLCPDAQRQMPLHGTEDLLLQLPGTLL